MKEDISEVGDAITAKNAAWTFSGDVAQTFDGHVRELLSRVVFGD